MPRLVNDIWGQNVVKERITKYNIKYKAKQKKKRENDIKSVEQLMVGYYNFQCRHVLNKTFYRNLELV